MCGGMIWEIYDKEQKEKICREILETLYEYAKEKGYEFIQVKTVREGLYPDYDVTNAFCQKVLLRDIMLIHHYFCK